MRDTPEYHNVKRLEEYVHSHDLEFLVSNAVLC